MIHLFNIDLKNTRVVVVLAVLAVGLVAAPFFSFVTFAAAVMLLAGVKIFGLGIFSRAVLALVFAAVLGAMLLQVSTLLSMHASFVFIHIILLIVAAGYALLRRDELRIQTSAVDVVGFLVGTATFLFVIFPLLGAAPSKTLEYLVPGEDNNSHFQMYRYVVTEGKYGYRNPPADADIRPTLLSYAQGSHGAMAVATAPFAERVGPLDQLKVYAFAAAATFAMTFWLAFLVIAKPLQHIKHGALQAGLAALLGFVFVVAAPLGLFLSLYTYGYFPQYFSYLAFAFVLLAATASPLSKKQPASLAAEVSALLVGCYAVFAAWYLIAPLAAAVVAAYVWTNRQELSRYKWLVLALIAPVAILGAHLAYVFVLKSNGVGHLLTPGGVEKMDWWVLLASLPALVAAAVAWRQKDWALLGFSASVLVAAAIAAAIGMYQKKQIGHVDYYFYKTLFTALFAALLYYGYLAGRWLSDILTVTKLKRLNITAGLVPVLGVTVLCAIAMVFNPPAHIARFLTAKYELSQQATARVLDVFTDTSLFDRYSDVITLGSCNPYANFTGTIWAGGFFLPYTPERQKIENELLTRAPELAQPNSAFLAEVGAYAATKSKPVAVMYSSACSAEHGREAVATLKNVTVIGPAGD